MRPLLLASASPRRRELLAKITTEFRVEPSLFEESAKGLSAYETVLRFSRGKAEETLSRFPACLVLAADTVVSSEGETLGKPTSAEDAKRMLRGLSGRTHEVYTGVCVRCAEGEKYLVSRTHVTFFPLTDALIDAYVASGSPLDKAGAYGIQDPFPIVKNYRGSYSNVMGLPLRETWELLRAFGGNYHEVGD